MEHTELKKETSIDWLMTQLYKKGFIKEIDGNEPIFLMNQAKEMEKQQKGYSEEDLKYAFDSGRVRLTFDKERPFVFKNYEEFIEQFKNK